MDQIFSSRMLLRSGQHVGKWLVSMFLQYCATTTLPTHSSPTEGAEHSLKFSTIFRKSHKNQPYARAVYNELGTLPWQPRTPRVLYFRVVDYSETPTSLMFGRPVDSCRHRLARSGRSGKTWNQGFLPLGTVPTNRRRSVGSTLAARMLAAGSCSPYDRRASCGDAGTSWSSEKSSDLYIFHD